MKLHTCSAENLKPGPWKTTFMLKTDLKALAVSLNMFGWAQPLVVKHDTLEIIDGHERWQLTRKTPLGKEIPVLMYAGDTADSALLHIHLNRDRGAIQASQLGRKLKIILRSRKYDEQHLMKQFAMTADELDVLLEGTLLRKRNIAEHNYSRAWVPIEAPAGTHETVNFETPPNNDQGEDQ
jgi:ParB-like chromosome segregation protein Spo0J